MIILRKIPYYVWMATFFLMLTVFIFRSSLMNMTTNLPDWLDYSLMVWIINQNTEHIRNLQLVHFFNSNIFYPFQGTMLFSDLLLPSSILGLFFQLFSSNPVLVFNLIFFATLPLNILASFLLWRVLFKEKLLIFFGTLITAFSPYFFLELGHFQLLNFWPFLFGLYFLFKEKFSIINAILIGLMISMEFFSSVYLWIFMLFVIGIWYGMKILQHYSKKETIKHLLIHGVVVLTTMGILSGIVIFKYVQIKQSYNIVRSPGEYILYSAHLSDYLFTNYYHSFISTTKLINAWNNFNMHKIGESASFPGFALLFLAIIGLTSFQKNNKEPSIGIKLSFYNIYFLILLIMGFLFSLGPRLNVNGTYLAVPLPYYVLLKFVPLVEPIRANARWMLLLFIGLAYFALLGLKKIGAHGTKGVVITGVLSILLILEIAPVNRTSDRKEYYPQVYQVVQEKCKTGPKVLLEYPLTRFIAKNNLIEDLTYKNQLQMASINHKCLLVNGYSGYTPKDYERYENQLFWAIEKKDKDLFWQLIAERKVNLFKLNKESLYKDRVEIIKSWLKDQSRVRVYINNDSYLVAEIYKI